tara:strand:- start:2130 stop:3746 length:1617 start_codon:yes stop_codon:yes gene_type:complete
MTKKIKIGIVLCNNKKFLDWQIRLFSEIAKSNFAEITNLFFYEEINNDQFFSRNKLINLIIRSLESKYFNIQRKKELIFLTDYLENVKSNNLVCDKSGIQSLLNSNNLIYGDFDVLINLDNKNINNELLKLSKYGAWYLDFNNKNEDYAAFWECFDEKDVTEVSLKAQILKNQEVNFKIIEKGIFDTKFNSWYFNREFALEKSVILFLKNLSLISENLFSFKNEELYTDQSKYEIPNLFTLLKYVFKKYPRQLIKSLVNFMSTKNEKNQNIWNLHIGKRYKDKFNIVDSIKIDSPKNMFWSDPFLFSKNNKYYLFFESYDFIKKKGKISVGELNNKKIINVQDALNLNYHLSYPFIWCDNNNIFMIPETHETKRIEIWKSVSFPNKWNLHKVLFEGESCVDTTIFTDKDGINWLFTNKSFDKFEDHNTELYIYKFDKDFQNIKPHKLNPVLIDCRNARNGGNIFYNNDGNIIRSSQINIKNTYGYGLNLSKIDKLSLNKYCESNIENFSPKFKENINGLHHLTLKNDVFVIDVRYKRR